MAKAMFRAGELYPSRSVVRAHYREYRKGILVRDGDVAVIQAYRGLARRVHYPDSLNPETLELRYVGEGLRGDQSLARGNGALYDAANSGRLVGVFLDCGDIHLPAGREKGFEKHLLSAGPWKITKAKYGPHPTEGRMVWMFTMEPADDETRAILQSVFQDGVAAFEDVLRRFATVRTELYSSFAHILRARDSIAGHVGEYFAVKRFNKRFPERPLVRVRSNFKDLDAIQTGSGARYAVKTVTKATQTTSNIWTPLADLPRSIDAFLVLDLDPFALEPRGLFRLPVSKAPRFWRTDRYQGAGKLSFDEEFRRVAEAL